MLVDINSKSVKAYSLLLALVIFGLLVSTITTNKIVHFGINFPFSDITFSVFTYPLVDCICELWGKHVAKRTVLIALLCQVLVAIVTQLSIIAPPALFWHHQEEYKDILATSYRIALASITAFTISQLLDIVIYQKIKDAAHGKLLWLRSNMSICIGQIVDSSIFISIVFYTSHDKLSILCGSIAFKSCISVLMTPIIYLIIYSINKYLDFNTLAFKGETK